MNLLALLGLSLALGLRHAADPDHAVAVSAISARTRRLSGAAWLGVDASGRSGGERIPALRAFPSLGRWTRLATGALSLLFGIWLIYRIGWRDGLFLPTPGR